MTHINKVVEQRETNKDTLTNNRKILELNQARGELEFEGLQCNYI